MRCLCANEGRVPEPALWGALCPTWAQSISTVFSSVKKVTAQAINHGKPGLRRTLRTAPSQAAAAGRALCIRQLPPRPRGHTCLTHTHMHTHGECSVHACTRRQAHACTRVHPHTCTRVHTEALLEKFLSSRSEAQNLPGSWCGEFVGKSEQAEHGQGPRHLASRSSAARTPACPGPPAAAFGPSWSHGERGTAITGAPPGPASVSDAMTLSSGPGGPAPQEQAAVGKPEQGADCPPARPPLWRPGPAAPSPGSMQGAAFREGPSFPPPWGRGLSPPSTSAFLGGFRWRKLLAPPGRSCTVWALPRRSHSPATTKGRAGCPAWLRSCPPPA